MRMTNSSIEITTADNRVFRLRELLHGDTKFLLTLRGRELSPRELTAEIIHNQLIEPALEFDKVVALNDETLIHIVVEWAKTEFRQANFAFEDVNSFEEIQRGYEEYIAYFTKKTQEAFLAIGGLFKPQVIYKPMVNPVVVDSLKNSALMYKDMASLVSSSLKTLVDGFKTFSDVYARNIEQWQQSFTRSAFSPFTQNLPDFVKLAERFAKLEKNVQTIKAGEFGFVIEFLTLDEINQLGDVILSPITLKATVTKKFLAYTRSQKFYDELKNLFHSSKLLERRWKIVAAAYEAHMQRNYILSIPPLIAQSEAIMAQLLIVRGTIQRNKEGKLYILDITTGKPQLTGNGKPKILNGLENLVNQSKYKDDELLKSLADFLVEKLAPSRNGVMHGYDLNYGKARTSTQALMTLYILASELEYQDKQTKQSIN